MNDRTTAKADTEGSRKEPAICGYTAQLQKKIAAMLLYDPQIFPLACEIIRPKYFDNPTLQDLVAIMLRYMEKYGKLMPPDIFIQEVTDFLAGKKPNDPLRDEDYWDMVKSVMAFGVDGEFDYVRDRVLNFAKYQGVKQAIMDSVDLLQTKRDYDGILQKITKAVAVGSKQGFDPYAFMRTGSQLQAFDIHVDWTVDKLIPEGAITLLHGPAGLGKTWLCLAIAKAVSEGVPFLGLQTKQREVVYIDYENPLAIDHDRTSILNVCTPRFWHLSDPARPPKLDGPDWHLLKTLHRGSLIIIDTARGATDGDEIKGQDVALVMNRLKEIRELGNDIILQAHTSKANKRLSKGATTWEDLADHVLAFYRAKPGTMEEIEEEGFDPNALLFLGTGNKTRYEPCRYYVSLNPANGTFALVEEPNAEAINALDEYIKGPGLGENQKEIIKWAMSEGLGSRNRSRITALLKRGEREGYWHSRKSHRGTLIYEPRDTREQVPVPY